MIFSIIIFNNCVVNHHMKILNHCSIVGLLGYLLYLINVKNRLVNYSAVVMKRNRELEAWALGPALSGLDKPFHLSEFQVPHLESCQAELDEVADPLWC